MILHIFFKCIYQTHNSKISGIGSALSPAIIRNKNRITPKVHRAVNNFPVSPKTLLENRRSKEPQ